MYSLEAIRKTVFRMFECRYDEKSRVPVRFDAGEIAGRMADCRGLAGEKRQAAVGKIMRSVKDFFWIDSRDDGSRLLYLNYNKRNRLLRLEGRYFSLETCVEFAIASGMDYTGYRKFSEYLMGFSWNYLRNPEYLVGDFCLRFGLSPERYRELTDYAKDALDHCPPEAFITNKTVNFRDQYSELVSDLNDVKNTFSEEDMITEIKRFIDDHTVHLKGNFSRTLGYISEMVRSPASGSFLEKIRGGKDEPNVSRLNGELIRATMSWEYKSRLKPEDGISALFGEDAAPADITIARHTALYCINMPSGGNRTLQGYEAKDRQSGRYVDCGRRDFTENFRFEMANMQVIRNDLVRVMLMNMTDGQADLADIDLALERHSFTPLSDDDPFDYLVKCAVEIYGAAEEEKPENLRGLCVYDVLCGLKEMISLEESAR